MNKWTLSTLLTLVGLSALVASQPAQPVNTAVAFNCASVVGVVPMSVGLPLTADASARITGCGFGGSQGSVEICNASSYGGTCVTATVTSWAATDITATINEGSFTNGTTVWLYVTTSGSVRNSQGLGPLALTVSSGGSLTCSDSTSTTTSAGLQTFLNTISTGGTAGNPRVLCMTANIALTTHVAWDPPDYVTVWGGGATGTNVGASGGITITDSASGDSPGLSFTGINQYFRLTGFTYVVAAASGFHDSSGVFSFSGDTTQFRWDHFTLNASASGENNGSPQNKWAYISGCLYGLIDHSSWILPNDLAWIHFVNGGCDDVGGSAQMGNTTWTRATGFGGATFMYFEDSEYFVDGAPDGGFSNGSFSDCHTAGKFVVRFSSFKGASVVQTHPTIHGADDRGCRGHEAYGNKAELHTAGDDPSYAFDYNNSGPAMVWGNDVGTNALERILYFNDCRRTTDSGDPRWCGYFPTATPDNWGRCGAPSGWDGNTDAEGYPCIDQPGRGVVQDLISLDFPSKKNNRTGGIAWPVQAFEPIYEWLTTGTGRDTFVDNRDSAIIVQNRDYYLHKGNSSCNAGAGSCTAGVGVGTLAQRPANCTTSTEAGGGVGWWATDQGSWNTSSSNPRGDNKAGADGVLYRCSATNTWTVHYTPYTYPHPLNN